MGGSETTKPRRQPSGAEGRRCRYGEQALAAADIGHGATQCLERIADRGQQPLACRGQCQSARTALEQLDPELVLERAKLMADGRLGHMQLTCSPGETSVAGRGLEHPK